MKAHDWSEQVQVHFFQPAQVGNGYRVETAILRWETDLAEGVRRVMALPLGERQRASMVTSSGTFFDWKDIRTLSEHSDFPW